MKRLSTLHVWPWPIIIHVLGWAENEDSVSCSHRRNIRPACCRSCQTLPELKSNMLDYLMACHWATSLLLHYVIQWHWTSDNRNILKKGWKYVWSWITLKILRRIMVCFSKFLSWPVFWIGSSLKIDGDNCVSILIARLSNWQHYLPWSLAAGAVSVHDRQTPLLVNGSKHSGIVNLAMFHTQFFFIQFYCN